MEKERDRLWSWDFIILCLAALIARLAFTCQYTAIPMFVISLDGGKAAAGTASAIYSLSALLFRPLMGNAVDRFGRQATMTFGISVFTFSMAVYVLSGAATTVMEVYLLQFVNGLGFSAFTVGMTTVCTDVVPLSRLAQGIGIFGLSSTLANAFAPGLALFAIESTSGYSGYFFMAGAIAVVGIISTLLIRYERRQPKKVKREQATVEEQTKFLDRIVEKSAVWGSAMVILVSFASSAINNFLPTLATEYAIAGISLFFTLQAVGTAVSRLGAGTIMKRLGVVPALIFGYLCYAVGYSGIFSLAGAGVVIAMGVLCGIGQGLTQTILNTAAVANTPAERRGAANATFYMAMDIAIGLGGCFWGVVADAAGTRQVYLGTALLSVGVIVYTWFCRKKVGSKLAISK